MPRTTPKLQVQKHKAKSSPALRDAADKELHACTARQKVVRRFLSRSPDWAKKLLGAARFAVDVHGAPPSLDDLAKRVATAEQRMSYVEEDRELCREIQRMRGKAIYYQYAAGVARGMFFHVHGQGDTRKEAIADAERKGASP